MVYGLDVYLDGVSVMDRVLELVTDPEKQITMENIAALNWEPDFIRGLRAIPCPYHRYYYKTREMLEEEKEASVEKGTRAEVVKQLENDLFELYKDPNWYWKISHRNWFWTFFRNNTVHFNSRIMW